METRYAVFFLVCYHFLLFRHFYFQNPYVYARSEALEQGFACSIHLGRWLRQHGLFNLKPVDDPYYYPDYTALPFLSTYYWPHRLQAWIGSWLSLDGAWLLYSFTMVLHFLASSIAVFMLLKTGMTTLCAVMGAITLSSLGYAMKQNSCIVYTLAWIPVVILFGMMHSWLGFGISLGMMLLAGYWPIALYTIPLGCWFSLKPLL